ncbi:hypothetical protein AVEN_114873-1 [Araneus ventricosus]|uniref:Uncharacterized protein n=1 Tax=Araneus ventricosus TaxID=182803 RepID=A0A4Y2PJZ7_ARAVE|nr:hypothetical protein AVEN_218117-1 [Araneus ventricosus]GBN50850.1 hypothetical protein AVEN_114873-1 [Araneus ventricosus]
MEWCVVGNVWWSEGVSWAMCGGVKVCGGMRRKNVSWVWENYGGVKICSGVNVGCGRVECVMECAMRGSFWYQPRDSESFSDDVDDSRIDVFLSSLLHYTGGRTSDS